MPLKVNHTRKSIDDELEAGRKKIDQVITNNVVALGFKAANHARTNRGYTDRTGNLVNSTGFIVLKDWVSVFENFEETFRGGVVKNEEGQIIQKNGLETGRAYATELSAEFNSKKGWVLIVFAGMEYASNVEKVRGRNVLAATELYIKTQWPKMVQRTVTTINKMKIV
jgi:hypothetical protein